MKRTRLLAITIVVALSVAASGCVGLHGPIFDEPSYDSERGHRERRRSERQPQRMEEQRPGPQQRQAQSQQVSSYALEVIKLTNAERRRAGLGDLAIDNELVGATALRARELERAFSHNRPDGRSYDTVLREFSVRPYNFWGENILHNMSNKPADAMQQWMNSSGHRANILKREYTHIGVGVHQSQGNTYVVQIFLGRR